MAAPITIEAYVAASPETAWRIFCDADAMTEWNFASPAWCCPRAKVDLRVGGTHFARMEARDGSMGFDYVGTYEVVDPPRAITLRLEDGRGARTTFDPEGAGTRVRTVFDPEPTHPLDLQRDGWQAILNNYAAYAGNLTREESTP